MRSLAIFSLGFALVSSTPGLAKPPEAQSSQARASEGATEQVVDTATDEEVVCRRDKTVGSRIKAQRICMTRAQWAAQLREERTKIEQGQAQRTYTDNN